GRLLNFAGFRRSQELVFCLLLDHQKFLFIFDRLSSVEGFKSTPTADAF
ncbi:unnamed protein product, partial [Larinioides sclopetarius]